MNKQKGEYSRVVFNLESNTHQRLKQLALDKNTKVTYLLREWIAEKLEMEEMKQKKLNDY